MQSLSQYITEKVVKKYIDPEYSVDNAGDNTSDDALLYRVGFYNLNWKPKESQEKIIKKYNIRGDHFRQGIIQWQREASYPLLPDDLEIVHRKDWELDILNGVSLDALYHKHYTMWFDNMYKNYKPKHKVLTVFECSNKKPYCYTQVNKYYVLRFAEFTDFASIAYGIIPWDFTNMYPVRWDEWDHYSEDPYMAYCYAEATKKGILEFHKRFPEYEKIIFVCQNNKPQRPANELWEDNTDNFRDWAVILTDDDFRKSLRRSFKPDDRGGEGIMIQRTLILAFTKKKYAELLAKQYKDQETKDLIMKRLCMDGRECEQSGLTNIYDPEMAKVAYKQGVMPCDTKFIEEYKKNKEKE